jgi:predicted nucleic acid-binding protein
MSILLDSSVLIPVERGELDLVAALDDQKDEEVAMAAITASELLHGVELVRSAVARSRVAVRVERLLAIVPVVPFDLDVSRVHATLGAELRSRGAVMGAHDLIIAATAVYLDAAVATRDLRGFARIKGLRILKW